MKKYLWPFVLVACGKKDPSPEALATTASASASVSVGAAIAPGGPPRVEKFDAAEVQVPLGKSQLHVAWSLPDGTAINDDAPFAVRWGSSDGLATPPNDIHGVGKQVAAGFDIPIEIFRGGEGGRLNGDMDLVVCDVATHSVCVPLKRRLEITFAATRKSEPGRLTLPLPKAKP